MARRMGALCEALTNISKLRRQSSYNCRRRYSHQTQFGGGPPDGSKTTMTDATDPRFASWHAAIPVVEMINWPSGQSSEHAPLPAPSLSRERVNVTVEDIGQIISHLERLRAPSAYSSRDTNDATMEVHRDVELASDASIPSMSQSGSYLQGDGRVGPRNLYIVGVGWSNASSPLLQYVMLYGAQTRIDGIICINQTASSNYALVPETASSSQRKLRALGRDRNWSVRSHKTPFHSTFLLAPAGATRLLLLAARLHLTADRLLELQKKRQRRCRKTMKGDFLCAEDDAAIWDYLQRTVGNCAFRDHQSPTANNATFYPALSSTGHLFSRSTLSSAESPLDFLLQVEAQVDEEMSSWWIDVQAGNDDDDESTRGRSLSSRGDRAAPFLSSGGWHSLMGLLDWDELLKNQQNASAATRASIGLSGHHTLPSSPHVTSSDTLNAECAETSRLKNDDRAEPAKTAAGNDDENVCGEEVIPPSHGPARPATPLFEMARGGPDLLLSAHLLSPVSQNCGDTPRHSVAPNKSRCDINARPGALTELSTGGAFLPLCQQRPPCLSHSCANIICARE
ncbi:trans-sialidase, putative [Trypanosoma cruzi marinkellei]|uniref:Trans-sialidase, putative n=1 Tax=Trypanosoma cruzi marinkellei TaxID=85056 RepID=K2NDE3_TRYCR|nr:trans-sialidase, putative [Trypanosoma cruzi marinkellei]